MATPSNTAPKKYRWASGKICAAYGCHNQMYTNYNNFYYEYFQSKKEELGEMLSL